MTDVRAAQRLLARMQYLNGLAHQLAGLNTALDGTDQPTPPTPGRHLTAEPEEA